MSPQVNFESASSRVTFAAVVAAVGFVASVYQFMGLEMPFRYESFSAAFIAAYKGTFTSLKEMIVFSLIILHGFEYVSLGSQFLGILSCMLKMGSKVACFGPEDGLF
jgi:hypothetical protein